MSEALEAAEVAPRPISFRGAGEIVLRGDAWGDPGGRPVLLLHGGGQTRHSWAAAGRRLSEDGWHAIALDLRGHGDSDWAGEGAYQPHHFVGDLQAVVHSLGRPPAVVGASLGGMTALIAEGESDAPVTCAVVLVDVTPRIESRGVARIIEFMLARPEGFASLEEAADAVAAYRQHRVRSRDLQGLRKNLRQGSDGRWRWHWDPYFVDRQRLKALEGVAGQGPVGRFNDAERLLAAARRIAVPTLLVRGRESDVVSPEGAREFLDAVPHAHFVDVSDAGHTVAGDRNDAFNEAVVAFLREVPS